MIFVEPSHAQHLIKNIKKTIQKSSQNPLKMVSRGLQKTLPKNVYKKTTQKSQKNWKWTIFGCPRGGERTGNERTFGDFFGSGRPWDTPGAPLGAKMVPRPPPRASGTPPNLIFYNCWSIFDVFFSFFDGFPHVLWSLFGVIFFIILRCVFDIVSYKVVALRGALTPQP